MHNYYVYMMSNWTNNVLYTGMTNNLEQRVAQHHQKLIPGFTKKYNVVKLVYYEHCHDVNAAIVREKEIKDWRRELKNALVESMNPDWRDLLCG